MAHQHEHAHLVRRQREVVETVVSIRYVSAKNTYTGPVNWVTPSVASPTSRGVQLIAPAERSREDTAIGAPVRASSTQASTLKKPSATPSRASNDDDSGIDAPSTPLEVQSTLMIATKAPTPSAGSLVAAVSSATASVTASASAGSAEGGMSTGAKAGLAFGILFVVGALLTGILILYHRKKKQQQSAASQDNEKIDLNDAPRPLPPQVQAAPAVAAAPSIQTQRTMSTAPRLSLRPVTQFDPAFENRKSAGAGNLLSVAAAAAPPTPSKERELPDRPRSAWERPGAANVAPADNPFIDPQQSSPPSVNPFGNDAALDPTQAQIPNSPPNASPLHSTQPSADFANPAVAIASAEVAPVAAATAMASIPSPKQELPAPPSIKAPSDGVPASPAWTEDFPASPGPAPVGPPPVAGAIVGARSNSPAPPAVDNVHRVQLDFKPSMQDELGLHAGQLVRMLHEYDDGWALCIRMDRSQQGVVPRTCLSKHPVKPRTGPPRQGPPPPGVRGPPIRSPMGPGGVPQPRPLSPASGRNSPAPPGMSPGPRSMSPGPRQMSPHMQGSPRGRSNSNAPQYGPPRGRSNSNAPYAGPPRSMSPGPYGGGPQMTPPPQMGRPRANSASQVSNQRRVPAPGPSPMNPNAGPMPSRKPVPGMAL